ncbi:MAG: hypothetical protein M1837_001346 [Sclerophora amabilis]|nr:MAG: hypothetical protein M1837_001346 [Sclerophora amabilis]
MASKIIVIGSPSGNLRSVLTKLTTLHSKNSFSLAIILGDLFADPTPSDDEVTSLLDNSSHVPLPTYFTLGHLPLPQRIIDRLSSNSDELVPNLYFLGKRTTLTTSEGIKLVALGGHPSPDIKDGVSKDKYTPFYTPEDARSLRGANSADILLTASWPATVRNGSKVGLPAGAEDSSSLGEDQAISDLCATLRPRYHFSTSSTFFYEREPFYHPSIDPSSVPEARQITRFISLASYNNSTKQKSLYAFIIDPKAPLPTSLPAGATPSPLAPSTNNKRRPLPSQATNYRFSNPTDGHNPNKRRRGGPPPPPPGPNECFFCLSNPNLATHLITSIGSDSYLTTARGPLSTASSTSSNTLLPLTFPTHILIIPLAHSPTLSGITDGSSTKNEMQRYRRALQAMLQELGEGKYGTVTWEVSRSGGVHVHWQFLAIDADLVRRGLVEAALKVEVENQGWPVKFKTVNEQRGAKEAKGDDEDDVDRDDYFRVWIWQPAQSTANGDDAAETKRDDAPSPSEASNKGDAGKGKEKCLILPLPSPSSSIEFRFDVQFGRKVLAKLLGQVGWNWKDCLQSQEEEQADAAAFKAAFKEFDFSLQG